MVVLEQQNHSRLPKRPKWVLVLIAFVAVWVGIAVVQRIDVQRHSRFRPAVQSMATAAFRGDTSTLYARFSSGLKSTVTEERTRNFLANIAHLAEQQSRGAFRSVENTECDWTGASFNVRYASNPGFGLDTVELKGRWRNGLLEIRDVVYYLSGGLAISLKEDAGQWTRARR